MIQEAKAEEEWDEEISFSHSPEGTSVKIEDVAWMEVLVLALIAGTLLAVVWLRGRK